jgi:hypothetical protein
MMLNDNKKAACKKAAQRKKPLTQSGFFQNAG